MKYAAGGSRFLSGLIDNIIFGAIGWLIPNESVSSIIILVVSMAYSVWMIGMYGSTIGMMIMKIKIVKENGKKVNYSDVLVREIASILSLIALLIGYLGIWTDSRKQTWHDKIAHTVVLKS